MPHTSLVNNVLIRYYPVMTNTVYMTLERIASVLRSEARAQGQGLGLQPVHMDTLYYLASCNRYSDTPLGVTEYLCLTKGTVSQTIKLLENKGLIRKNNDPGDKRVVHLALTRKGHQFVEQQLPPPAFEEALGSLPATTQSALDKHLQKLLSAYQSTQGREGFGICRFCRHNQSDTNGFVCGLTRDRLTDRDVQLICREFD